jgi:hypothetical protein
MKTFENTIKTSGQGLWSRVKKSVKVTSLDVSIYTDMDTGEENFGELRVYFDTKTWNTQISGLIYTDRGFIETLQKKLDEVGLAGFNVDYSEQGMQGYDYVSLDIGSKFIKSWREYEAK